MNAVTKNTFIAMVSLALFYFIFLESNSFYLSSMSSFSLESRFASYCSHPTSWGQQVRPEVGRPFSMTMRMG